VIALPRDFVDDSKDPQQTRRAVAGIIRSRTAEEWRPVFAKADCCVTIVAPLEQAIRDPHFQQRGLFAPLLESREGTTMPALPVPVAPQFRSEPGKKKAPPLG
jgi:crotonobetainyl-CoA:carnitine CoA-transferase CaiB-like acyl-CoA transferase